MVNRKVCFSPTSRQLRRCRAHSGRSFLERLGSLWEVISLLCLGLSFTVGRSLRIFRVRIGMPRVPGRAGFITGVPAAGTRGVRWHALLGDEGIGVLKWRREGLGGSVKRSKDSSPATCRGGTCTGSSPSLFALVRGMAGNASSASGGCC